MDNIKSIFQKYDDLIAVVSEEIIRDRLRSIAHEMTFFLDQYHLDNVRIDDVLLCHSVMDYFSDIQRLKEYQEIEHINEYKICVYESFWLLQRKPLQITGPQDDDKWAFVNEKFVLFRISRFLLRDNLFFE